MKKFNLPWIIAVIVLSVALIAVSAYAVIDHFSTDPYTESTSAHEWSKNSNKSSSAGIGKSDTTYVEARFLLAADKITEKTTEKIENVFENTLKDIGVTNIDVSAVKETEIITVRIYVTEDKSESVKETIKNLSFTSKFTICGGMTYSEGNIILDGSCVDYAEAVVQNGQLLVQITFTEDGKQKFADATRSCLGNYMAICLDHTVLMAPKVGAIITDGIVVISGGMDSEECNHLVNGINSSTLSGLRVIDVKVVRD